MKDKPTQSLDRKPQKSNKTRVLIDLDGVIRDFVGSLIEFYQRKYPDHEVLPVHSRKLEDFFPIGKEIYDFMEPETIKQILEQAKSYPGTIESLQRWQDEFEIVVVTAQPDRVKSSTYIWIGKNDIPTNEVHISYYKSDIKGFALLDDFTDNLQEFAETGRLAVCYNQPWNQNWNGPRIHNLDEFFELVQFELNKNEESPEPKGKIT